MLGLLIRKSLRQHAFATSVTALCVALGSGLVMAVFSVNTQARDAFRGGAAGFDAVLGARGSKLQLVLNTVYHLDASPGNVPWSLYQAIKSDARVKLAIPYAVGDNYKGFRIVGTTEEIFTKFEYQAGKPFRVQSGGSFFDSGRREAVVGSFVAQKTGLKVGDVINPYHGLQFDENKRHADEYTVVGILEPTNSPSDRVVFIPIEGIFRMEGHVLRGTGSEYRAEAGAEIPDEAKEVSAVMLKLKNPAMGLAMSKTINDQGKVATLAWPVDQIILDLFDRLGWMTRVLGVVAWLTVLLAALSILASVTNTISERRREFAILRSLGAPRSSVFAAVVGEGAVTALLGAAGGFAIYIPGMLAAAAMVQRETGVVLNVWSGHPILYFCPIAAVLLGALAGVLPAWRAYRTDIAAHLTPTT